MATDNTDSEYVEFYRSTTVGIALIDTLNEMVALGDIPESVAHQVFANFESSFLEVLKAETSKTVVPSVKIEVPNHISTIYIVMNYF